MNLILLAQTPDMLVPRQYCRKVLRLPFRGWADYVVCRDDGVRLTRLYRTDDLDEAEAFIRSLRP